MNSALIGIGALIILAAAHKLYGGLIARIWKIDPARKTPAHILYDGIDYVPARHWTVLFGHHFASIAGAGPILGPVIACALYGWVPAFLWIVLGSILIGGVHDFSALMLSVRHHGKSVADISEDVLGKKIKIFFCCFVWLALVLVIAVFSAVTAKTLIIEPRIVIPTFGLIAVAMIVGYMIYYLKWNLVLSTVFGLASLICLFILGYNMPIVLPANALTIWIIVLLVYSFIASVIPVNILLQPRDYLSTYILYFATITGFLGILISHPQMRAPAFISWRAGTDPIWPMMFVTIACGAISGFHSLVASGTTSKQIANEANAKRVGYGAMLAEAATAVIGIVAVCAGLYWTGGPKGLVYPELIKGGNWIATFGIGFGQLVAPLLGATFGAGLAIVALNSFTMTTLDTSARIGRYISEELFGGAFKWNIFKNRHVSAGIVVLAAAALALSNWQAIWPIFGASNQLIAALVLIIVTAYFIETKRNISIVLYPALFMLVTSVAALIYQVIQFAGNNNYFLASIGTILIILAAMTSWEAFKDLIKLKKRQ